VAALKLCCFELSCGDHRQEEVAALSLRGWEQQGLILQLSRVNLETASLVWSLTTAWSC